MKKSMKIVSLILIVAVLLSGVTVFAEDGGGLVLTDGKLIHAALPGTEAIEIFDWMCDVIVYNYVYDVEYLTIYKSVVKYCGLEKPLSETEYAYRYVIYNALLDDESRLEEFVEAAFYCLDPYSMYYDTEATERMNALLGSSNVGVGIGILLAEQGLVITEVYTGSAAEKAGIQVGDIVTAINGTSTEGLTDIDKIGEMMPGDEGTEVHFTIKRAGEAELLEISAVKGEFENTQVNYRFIGDALYIVFDQFVFESEKQIERALQEADKRGIKKVILDVRGNSGGSVESCAKICELFLPKGKTIVEMRSRSGDFDSRYRSESKLTKMKYDLVVLTDKNSVSASEMLAMALQQNDACTIIGTKTYGKRVMQILVPMEAIANAQVVERLNGMIGMSVAEVIGPEGKPVPEDGLAPDITSSAVLRKTKDNPDAEPIEDYTTIAPLTSQPKVAGLKKRLSLAGYFVRDVYSDVYDIQTVEVVKMFQKKNGLVPSGYLDGATQMEILRQTDNLDSVYDEPLNRALEYLKVTK